MKIFGVLPTAAVVAWMLLVPSDGTAQNATEFEESTPWNVNWGRLDEDEDLSWSLSNSVAGPWEFGGWISAGFTANAHGNRTENGNAPFPLNNVADRPILNQLWLYAEKPVDTEINGFDWGFRIDYLFGADAPDFQADGDQGWDYGWNSSRDYGSAIPELYVEVGSGDLRVLAGYFIGLQGFEANQAVDNFFYSHNYGFGYGVPGTHSGVLTTYHVSDEL